MRDLRSVHGGPQRLRSHALHDPTGVKADDKRISRQVVVDEIVDLQPLIVELGPPVAENRLTAVAAHFHAIREIRDAALVVGELGGEEAEGVESSQDVVVQEINAVADHVRDGDAGTSVHCQCD